MTKLLYMEDSYRKDFEATVTKVDGKSIMLDQTCFYPLSGGQPGDTGVIVAEGKEYKVLNTIKKGPDVIHEVNEEGIKEDAKITGMIDWTRRYHNMRSHTACHMLCHVVEEETGALITGNQIKADGCRIDFDLENFDRDLIQSFEKKTNELIAENVPVSTKMLPREEAFAIPSVCKLKNVLPPSVDTIRIVEAGNYDTQACGGTHVKNSEEIKGIEIIKAENKGKNNRRIYFKLKE